MGYVMSANPTHEASPSDITHPKAPCPIWGLKKFKHVNSEGIQASRHCSGTRRLLNICVLLLPFYVVILIIMLSWFVFISKCRFNTFGGYTDVKNKDMCCMPLWSLHVVERNKQ